MSRKRARKKSARRGDEKPKNRHAAAMGRRGARSTNARLTPAQRIESARRAARARWAKIDTSTTPSHDRYAMNGNV